MSISLQDFLLQSDASNGKRETNINNLICKNGELIDYNGYGLVLTPGFFRFYSLFGCLFALHEVNLLKVTHASGSSAGALVAGILASGKDPCDLLELIATLNKDDMWDSGHVGFGVLKGQLFQNILTDLLLPKVTLKDTHIPLGVTAYNMHTFSTTIMQSNSHRHVVRKGHNHHLREDRRIHNYSHVSIATAVRASCTFPVLFQPVYIPPSGINHHGHDEPALHGDDKEGGHYHIDGGVWDDYGFMGLPTHYHSDITVPIWSRHSHHGEKKTTKKYKASSTNNESRVSKSPRSQTSNLAPLIVNILFDGAVFKEEKIPAAHKHCRVLTIVLNDIPNVNPVSSLQYDGLVAFCITRAAVLDSIAGNCANVDPIDGYTNRFICVVSGKSFVDTMMTAMKPVTKSTSSNHLELVHNHIEKTFEEFLKNVGSSQTNVTGKVDLDSKAKTKSVKTKAAEPVELKLKTGSQQDHEGINIIKKAIPKNVKSVKKRKHLKEEEEEKHPHDHINTDVGVRNIVSAGAGKKKSRINK